MPVVGRLVGELATTTCPRKAVLGRSQPTGHVGGHVAGDAGGRRSMTGGSAGVARHQTRQPAASGPDMTRRALFAGRTSPPFGRRTRVGDRFRLSIRGVRRFIVQLQRNTSETLQVRSTKYSRLRQLLASPPLWELALTNGIIK